MATAQRDCRKNLGSKNVQKNFPQQAKKGQNISDLLCGTPKSRGFSAFPSHCSKIIFERGLFRQFQRFAFAEHPACCPRGTGAGVGVDNAWEQEKLEATQSEMLDCEACRTQSAPASSARFVGLFSFYKALCYFQFLQSRLRISVIK